MANDQTAVKIIVPFSRASLGATRSGTPSGPAVIATTQNGYSVGSESRIPTAAFPVVVSIVRTAQLRQCLRRPVAVDLALLIVVNRIDEPIS